MTVATHVHMRPEPIRDDALLRAWFLPGEGERLVVSVSGLGSGDGTQGPEFVGSAHGAAQNPVLFLADPARSWLNAAGLVEAMAETVEQTVAASGTRQVSMLGAGMGGFAALVLPAFVETDTVLALAPEVSVHPADTGEALRWGEWRRRITDYRVRSAVDYIVPDTTYFVLHGDHAPDLPHRAPLMALDPVRHFMLPWDTHDIAPRLRAAGLLPDLVAEALNNRPRRVRRLLEQVGGHRSHDVPGDGPAAPLPEENRDDEL